MTEPGAGRGAKAQGRWRRSLRRAAERIDRAPRAALVLLVVAALVVARLVAILPGDPPDEGGGRQDGASVSSLRPSVAVPVPPPPSSGARDVRTGSRSGDGVRPRVAVVIDDLGMDRRATRRAIRLPAGVTLAFLPYAPAVARQAAMARARGHELLVHLPMEPVGGADPGPMALYRDLDEAEFRQRFEWNLSRLAGFVGINNHMGSAFTADVPAMRRLMRALASRGLLFLDSRTTEKTVARRTAARAGVRFARRAVFLDHERGSAAVAAALRRLLRRARRDGAAIAIGHPHPHTLAALETWLPTLERRGFLLVPVSSLARRPGAVAVRDGAGRGR